MAQNIFCPYEVRNCKRPIIHIKSGWRFGANFIGRSLTVFTNLKLSISWRFFSTNSSTRAGYTRPSLSNISIHTGAISRNRIKSWQGITTSGVSSNHISPCHKFKGIRKLRFTRPNASLHSIVSQMNCWVCVDSATYSPAMLHSLNQDVLGHFVTERLDLLLRA